MSTSSSMLKHQASLLKESIREKNSEEVLSYFADNCEMEISDLHLIGKESVSRLLNLIFRIFDELDFEPVTIAASNNTLFEEGIYRARKESKQHYKFKTTEVINYVDNKIESMRLYLDRLILADAVSINNEEKKAVNKINYLLLKEFLI